MTLVVAAVALIAAETLFILRSAILASVLPCIPR